MLKMQGCSNMTEMNEEIYGHVVCFDEHMDMWIAKDKDGEKVAANNSRRELLNTLQRINKQAFTRIPIYYGSDEWREADITSMQEDGDFWVSYKDSDGKNRRSKCYGTHYGLYKRNPANSAIVAELKELREKRNAISKQMNELSSKLERFKDEKEIRMLGGIGNDGDDDS